MDPWAPINGISLERYADLSAEVGDTKDKEKQAEIVGKLGVQRADWEAAVAGWTARMMDMSLMGQVATRYMPMYQAALAKKSGGVPTITFEDYLAMSGCVPVIGFEGMLQHYKVTSAQWTMIAGDWNGKIQSNPQYSNWGILVEQEAARIRAGGQPKPVTLGAPAPAAPAGPAAPAAPATPAGYGAQPGYAQPMAYAQPNAYAQQNPYAQQTPYAQQNPYAQQQAFNAQAQNVGAQVGGAFNAFGSALGSFVGGAVGAFNVGSRVMVQWSDGNRYPGTVSQAGNGQVEVAFPDGRRVWVPQHVVTATY